jgi:hypothetical protein
MGILLLSPESRDAMSIATLTAPSRPSARRRPWHLAMVTLLLASAFSFAGAALSPSIASAASLTVRQCNGVGPGANGATTGMTCRVIVVNTIKGTKTSSTTTVIRHCSLGPCPHGNGTFVTHSTSLVTSVQQCNGSDNDSAHPITCNVTITNNISGKVAGAQPVTAATVNQCVGSGKGGGGSVVCSPFPASTTGATVTQCNGSANGGGGTANCRVATRSRVSPAIAIRVNQCNGTGNPGGSIVRCRTTLTTNLLGAAAATPTTPQVSRVPSGGAQAGGGSMAGLQHVGLLALGGLLLFAAATGVLLRRRLIEGAGRSPR